MKRTINDLYKYVRYHFFEASVYNGSSIKYRWWAGKRILLVLLRGRKKSEKYLYSRDVIIENKEGLFFVPALTDFVLNISSKTEGNLIPYFTIPDGKTFLDIGANAGKWSIHIAKLSLGNRVLAFEPIPSTYTVLKRNIALNKLNSQVKTFNIGLSNQNSEIDFAYNTSFTGLNGAFSKELAILPEGFELLKIPVKTLDNVIQENEIEISSIDLIKIDVEGHELSVLEGAINSLAQLEKKTRMIIEIDAANTNKQKTMNLVSSIGFTKAKQLDEGNWIFEKV